MDDFGGMLSFELSAGEDAALTVAKSTSIWQLAESLGGVESLIEHPGQMTHATLAESPFAVPGKLIRLSTGIESARDLVADLADAFAAAVTRENRTLKRALTDPRILSGIGNAYSDEILHRARMSPFRRTRDLSAEDLERLREAVLEVLEEWTDALRAEVGDGFPDKVTAFRPGMAVHGKYGKPCPVCEAPVQRILYAENEANYCARCQTDGKLLADRVLSRLMKEDWPRTLEELEERTGPRPSPP